MQPEADLRPLDSVTGSWVDSAPARLRPWLRLIRADRPVGVWLLMWPCWWGVALAHLETPWLLESLWFLILFGAGAYLMRSAGCAYNDLLDRDLDRAVARTRDRPLASGQISSRSAVLLLIALSLAAFVILLQFNALTIGLGIASLGLVALYPLMKRITWWPQAWLGLTFNWGALLGWTAVRGTIDAPALMLYAAGFFWTIGYDTIYAVQDLEDDALAGVKSTARLFGRHVVTGVAIAYALATLLLLLAVIEAGTGWAAALVAFPASHLLWQTVTLRRRGQSAALDIFRSNKLFGTLVLIVLLLLTIF